MLLRAPAQAPLRGCYEMDLHARAREPVRTHAGARVKDITIRYKSDFAPYKAHQNLAESVYVYLSPIGAKSNGA